MKYLEVIIGTAIITGVLVFLILRSLS